MIQHNLRDTVLLSGWLFADLLLGLMMIFLVSIQGAHIPPLPVPQLSVTPTNFSSTSANCQGGSDSPQCVVTVSESQESVGSITWGVSSDMSDSINYTPASSTLKPGQSTQVNISAIPCQNGSFTFTGKAGTSNSVVTPVTIFWHCTAKQVRLDTNYHRLTLPNVDYNGLLSGSQSAINNVENQIRSQIPPQAVVGFAIVYDGTPDTSGIGTADNVDGKIYQILRTLGNQGFAFQRSSYYDKDALYTLGPDHSLVQIDVFYLTSR